jgi:hypothetical protein
MNKYFIISLCLGIGFGIFIAYIDTRPHWNDDGISVLMLLITSFICGALSSTKTWLIALAIGIWTPLFNIILDSNFGSLLALVPVFIGAYIGFGCRRLFKTI